MRIRLPWHKQEPVPVPVPVPIVRAWNAVTDLINAPGQGSVEQSNQLGPGAVGLGAPNSDPLAAAKALVEASQRQLERGIDREYFKGPPIVEETQARPKAVQNPSQMGMSALAAVRIEQPAPKRRLRIVGDD